MLVISNANGIGSTSFAIGIKTLYIQHSPWHVWFTSHSNSLMLPIEYYVEEDLENRNLNKKFSLAFSPLNDVPFNFEKNFYSKELNFNQKKYKKEILIASIREALSIEENYYLIIKIFLDVALNIEIKRRKFLETLY